MANHLTPTELARESGLERRDVIVKCCRVGRPDLQRSDRQDPLPLEPSGARQLSQQPDVQAAHV